MIAGGPGSAPSRCMRVCMRVHCTHMCMCAWAPGHRDDPDPWLGARAPSSPAPVPAAPTAAAPGTWPLPARPPVNGQTLTHFPTAPGHRDHGQGCAAGQRGGRVLVSAPGRGFGPPPTPHPHPTPGSQSQGPGPLAPGRALGNSALWWRALGASQPWSPSPVRAAACACGGTEASSPPSHSAPPPHPRAAPRPRPSALRRRPGFSVPSPGPGPGGPRLPLEAGGGTAP